MTGGYDFGIMLSNFPKNKKKVRGIDGEVLSRRGLGPLDASEIP